jgi:hypothetical protein
MRNRIGFRSRYGEVFGIHTSFYKAKGTEKLGAFCFLLSEVLFLLILILLIVLILVLLVLVVLLLILIVFHFRVSSLLIFEPSVHIYYTFCSLPYTLLCY